MGLLRYRSRKQYDPYAARSGDITKLENHDTLIASITYSGGVAETRTENILTVPKDFIAHIVGLSYFFNPSSGLTDTSIKVDGKPFHYVDWNTTDIVNSEEYEFEQAPIATGNITCTFTCGAGGLTAGVTIRYVLEPTARGYLV